jgi:AcrR family transcriptional regulator
MSRIPQHPRHRYTLRPVSTTESLSRAEQARRTRDGIIATATRLFAEQGYDGTSLQQIADEMGLTKAAVYYHFRSKVDLLREIVVPSFEALEAVVETAAAAGSRTERITVLITGVVDSLIAHRGRHGIVQSDPAIAHELDLDLCRFERLLDRAAQVLYGDDPTPEERASISIAAGIGKTISRMSDVPDDVLRESLIRACTRLLRVR